MRQAVHEGRPIPTQIEAKDLDDEKLLKPVLEDDALIVCLDDLPPPAAAAANGAEKGGEEVDSLLKRNSELQAELEQLSKQFANYRLTVEKTLDERWQADDEPEDAPTTKNGKRKDEYYFESYAHNGMPAPLTWLGRASNH